MNTLLSAVMVGFVAVGTAFAQPGPGTGGMGAGRGPGMMPRLPAEPRQGERMRSNFFPPQLVMRHQQDIGLTPDQEKTIRAEDVKFVGHITDLQWEKSAAEESLAGLLKQDNPDEKAILAAQEKLLKIEGDIKLSHLALLIRVKNTLTPEQRVKLTGLKERMEPRPWRGHEMWRHGMGMHPGFGQTPPYGPGMMQPVPRRFPMHHEGMGPGGQPMATPPPAGAGQP